MYSISYQPKTCLFKIGDYHTLLKKWILDKLLITEFYMIRYQSTHYLIITFIYNI